MGSHEPHREGSNTPKRRRHLPTAALLALCFGLCCMLGLAEGYRLQERGPALGARVALREQAWRNRNGPHRAAAALLRRQAEATSLATLPMTKAAAKTTKAAAAPSATSSRAPAVKTTPAPTATVTITAPSVILTQIATTIVSTVISTGMVQTPVATCVVEAAERAMARMARSRRARATPSDPLTATVTVTEATWTSTTIVTTTLVDALYGQIERKIITLGPNSYILPVLPTARARLPFCEGETTTVSTTTTTSTTRKTTTTKSAGPLAATLTLPPDTSPLDPTDVTVPTTTDGGALETDPATASNYGLSFCVQVFGSGSIRTTCADVCSFFLESTDAANIMACNKMCRSVAQTTGSFTTSCSAIFRDILTDTGAVPGGSSGGGSSGGNTGGTDDGFVTGIAQPTDQTQPEVPAATPTKDPMGGIATVLPSRDPTLPQVTTIYETIWVDPTPVVDATPTIVDFTVPSLAEESTSTAPPRTFDFAQSSEVPTGEDRPTSTRKTTSRSTGLKLISSPTSKAPTSTLIPILLANQNNNLISTSDVSDPIVQGSGAANTAGFRTLASLAAGLSAAFLLSAWA
ncbi:hypothetical protein DFJ74DRAFT_652202 [Hyaloraphidium curvatum]|nr:hypothetical protein DFJ74DRAFT_652202 [Hyaloraphidium curvatum]